MAETVAKAATDAGTGRIVYTSGLHPAKARLELSVEPDDHGSLSRRRAIFFPKGLSGRLYWLAVLPFHSLIFPAMSRNITAAAQKLSNPDAGSGNLRAAP